MATTTQYLLKSMLFAVLLILSTLHQRATLTFVPAACALFVCVVASAFSLRHAAILSLLGAAAGIAGLFLATLIPVVSTTVQEPVYLTNNEYIQLVRSQRIEFVLFGVLSILTGSAIGFLCTQRLRKE